MACAFHRYLCAYCANDPTRCQWCHVTWSLIWTSDYHSCDKRRFRYEIRRRVKAASALGATHSAPVASCATHDLAVA